MNDLFEIINTILNGINVPMNVETYLLMHSAIENGLSYGNSMLHKSDLTESQKKGLERLRVAGYVQGGARFYFLNPDWLRNESGKLGWVNLFIIESEGA